MITLIGLIIIGIVLFIRSTIYLKRFNEDITDEFYYEGDVVYCVLVPKQKMAIRNPFRHSKKFIGTNNHGLTWYMFRGTFPKTEAEFDELFKKQVKEKDNETISF